MKVLVVRFSSIGDVVITSAVLRALAIKYPSATIHFATKMAFAPLVQYHPAVHKVHALDHDFRSFVNEVKSEAFTHVIDLHKNLRTKRLRTALSMVKWYSYDKLNWQKWLYVNLKINRLPRKHIVHRYFEGLKDLDLVYDNKGLDFYLPANLTLPEGTMLPKNYVCYAIGGTYATKRLPIDKLEAWISTSTQNVVLIGGKDDWERTHQLQFSNLTNLCGKLNLLQSAMVIEQSEAVIAHDSGFMHITLALNKPVLSIWGNTVQDFGFYPLTKTPEQQSTVLEKGGLACRPCNKLGYDKCPKGHFKCMDFSAQEISREINALIE
jgi:ADP-heptose:LPS heptosyltransferase